METELLRRMLVILANGYRAFSHEILTVTTTAQGLAAVPPNAKAAFIQVESDVTDGKAIRYWEDGGIPTSSQGIFRGNGDVLEVLELDNILKFRVIQGTAGSTTLSVIYYY